MTASAGRPRIGERRRPGATTRDEILDAAAELFTVGGFTATSTRAVADAVGVRQASLYNHFDSKDAILAALLSGTVEPPLHFARTVCERTTDPVTRVHALAWFDARHLSSGRWNLGALYLLPELRADRFDAFRARRRELRELYTDLATDAVRVIGRLPADDAVAPTMPFRLVESVIAARWDDDPAVGNGAVAVADAAVRALGAADLPPDLRRSSAALVGDLATADARTVPGDGTQGAQEHGQERAG
ncbi:TetR/AcrR family transcriptional regulator [Rhodococcoides corynebacterioides]|uniref:TetR/AcrR family transcriptional regulator n=1 Tax=Rhodococcoides corynebacterioides TaxID=53972 RepID=UPI001C9A2FFC|nr:TetR/AcrR family transcriptional regulator [Rhodococcus corynebacterioides]MBY6351637.1 TetR/AcrR family transcriptional regulator [Rhodococcus corynebacterioides]